MSKKVLMQKPVASSMHQNAALILHVIIVLIFGLLALACIIGGVFAIYLNANSQTSFDIFGAHLTTSNVGVALVALGLVIAFLTIRAVLRNQRDLAKLPTDANHRGNVTTTTQTNITTGGDNAGRDINKL
jgi:uncharacterized membrane protein YbhN (UPF0104 family)